MLEKTILNSSEISKTQKHFLLTLDTYSDKQGKSWPSQEELAHRMSISVRYVKRILRQVVELGLVRVKRRWRRSNIYFLLCRKKLSTMGNRKSQENYPTNFKNVSKGKNASKRLSQDEFRISLEDTEAIMGKKVAKKNKGWIITLLRSAGYDTFQEGLRWVYSQIVLGEVSGRPIQSPCALLTWKLRSEGIGI